jgi:hypothetical protein
MIRNKRTIEILLYLVNRQHIAVRLSTCALRLLFGTLYFLTKWGGWKSGASRRQLMLYSDWIDFSPRDAASSSCLSS